MAEPFLGEVRLFGFGFPPNSWALCNGQLMAINQNQALYSLLGVTYGGDGSNTFGLPNMQGRAPIHVGRGFNQGVSGGEATHVLTTDEVPPHSHQAFATSATATTNAPSPTVMLAQSTAASLYAPATSTANMAANAVA